VAKLVYKAITYAIASHSDADEKTIFNEWIGK
jgi:hypothetical protein